MRVRVLSVCCFAMSLAGCSGLDTMMFSECLAQCQAITVQSEAAFRQCLQHSGARACSWQVPGDYLCRGERPYLPCPEPGADFTVHQVADSGQRRWFDRSGLLISASDGIWMPVITSQAGPSPRLECTTYQQMTQCYEKQ